MRSCLCYILQSNMNVVVIEILLLSYCKFIVLSKYITKYFCRETLC